MRNGNLAELLAKRASEAGWRDKPAYHWSHVVTHGEIHDGGARLGKVLKRRGLSRGDRVLLCLPDSPELVQLLLACLSRGIVAFLVNPELNRQDHAFTESDTEPALVVTPEALLDRFQQSRVAEAGELLFDAIHAEPADYEPVSGDAHAYATYTSGTTGAPKAAIHRHADVWAFIDAMCHRALRLTSQDTGLCSAPMYFAYGLGNSVWFPLATGSSAVITRWPLSAEATAELQCDVEAFGALRCADVLRTSRRYLLPRFIPIASLCGISGRDSRDPSRRATEGVLWRNSNTRRNWIYRGWADIRI